MQDFDTIFIANRGEIAVRVAASLRSLGIRSVAPYTEPDRNAYHTQAVDLAVPVGSYLNADELIAVALDNGAQAIHPGYGFLSENAGFSRACSEAGLVFIGPSPEAISQMGDKLVAKERMAKAGLPMVPSWDGDLDDVVEGARQVGFPLLVKAASGGGGKGMRLVNSEAELKEAIERAKGEALSAFGDDRIFLERFIENPRHIEVQIFGDQHGNAYCFGERECSLQRRYQKIIEEAPSLAVDPSLRQRLIEAGVDAVKALEYSGAGTVEFLLDSNGEFYFLEVNTRLQVEHPVTELVYGVDLVKLQVEAAEGKEIKIEERYLSPRGWSIEARIYAEDPDNGFLPSVGTLSTFIPPQAPNLRLDTGFRQGDEVSIHFDPMIAKLIAYGSTREDARRTLLQGLKRFAILGIRTNIPYLTRILASDIFITGKFDTQFLESHPDAFPQPHDQASIELAAALAGAFSQSQQMRKSDLSGPSVPRSPWDTLTGWRQQ